MEGKEGEVSLPPPSSVPLHHLKQRTNVGMTMSTVNGVAGSGVGSGAAKRQGFWFASLVSSEVRSVEAAMRINSRWSLVLPMGQPIGSSLAAAEDDEGDLTGIDSVGVAAADSGEQLVLMLHQLRRRCFEWGRYSAPGFATHTPSWSSIPPLQYLSPFLEIVRSEETNGPITGMALNSLHKILTLPVFGLSVGTSPNDAKAAVNAVVCSVTQCRFEATDPASDEVVLSKILYVLLDIARHECSVLLSDRNVCDMVQACFRIGHQTGKEGELLQRMARTYMIEIVREVFKNLGKSAFHEQETTPSIASHPHEGHAGASSSSASSRPAAAEENGGGGRPAADVLEDDDGVEIDIDEGYCGLASAIEIFQFGTSLFTIDGNGGGESTFDEEMSVFGLMMISTIMECIGPELESFPALLNIAKDELMSALLSSRSSQSVLVLSLTCSVFLSLYTHVRQHLVVQLECFVHGVLLRLAEGRGCSSDQQIIALEAISDLCRHPLFTLDLYATYDCAVESGNLFEEMCSVLSKTAFPVNVPLSRMHMLALDGLIAIVSGMAERCRLSPPLATDHTSGTHGAGAPAPAERAPGGESPGDFKEFTPSVWSEISSGPGVDRSSTVAPEALAFFSRRQKFIKRRLLVAIDHFNRKPKKGLEFLQHIHLLPEPLDAGAVASFLRMTPGLDKTLIGEYLGDPGDFQIEVLRRFTSMFDFGHMELDMAMRSYLTSFRLPGEAQKIARILEAFAEMFHSQSKAADAGGKGEAWACAKNADAIYVLSYSVIMLNTDLHNDQVKKKMSLEAFVRNNRGTNEGEDWPKEVLHGIYGSIEKYEIRMKDDGDALDITPGQWAAKLRRAEPKKLNFFGDTVSGGADRGAVTPASCLATGLFCTPFDKDMFAIFWGPTIAALSVVFDHAEDDGVLNEAVEGFMSVARVASYHNFIDVMDNLVISLCKFSALLNPTALNPAVTFGNDEKARVAVVCVFSLAHKYGDCIRNGWRNILDLVIRMHKLNILDYEKDDGTKTGRAHDGKDNGAATTIGSGRGDDDGISGKVDADRARGSSSAEGDEASERRTSTIVGGVSRKSHDAVRSRMDIKSSSSITNALATTLRWGLGLSSDDGDASDAGGHSGRAGADAGRGIEEYEAEKRTYKCVEDCHIDDIFTESKFLETESLFQLVRALIWAGGMTSASTGAAASSSAGVGSAGVGSAGASGGVSSSGAVVDEDTTVFCLGLLMCITLRNRDRIRHIWDVVHEHLSMIMLTATSTTPLVEVAVTELLQLCQRLLPYKEEIAEKLLVSLQLVLKLNEQVAYDLAEEIMKEVVCMLRGSVSHIKSADGWKTLLVLVLKTARHPEASALSFEALTIICNSDEKDATNDDAAASKKAASSSFLTPASFTICLDALISFVEAGQGGETRSIEALELMTPMHGRLVQWQAEGELPHDQIVVLWEKLIRAVTECCTDARADVRDAAVVLLSRALACADALGLSVEKWTAAFENIIFPLLEHLMKGVRGGARAQKEFPHASRTLRAAVALMCKSFLQPTSSPTATAYTGSESFGLLWMQVLGVLNECNKVAMAMKDDGKKAKADGAPSDASGAGCSKEELVDAVVEACRNMVMVLMSQGILAPGTPLWTDTMKMAMKISPTLSEEEFMKNRS